MLGHCSVGGNSPAPRHNARPSAARPPPHGSVPGMHPRVEAIAICDGIHQDPASGKVFLLGLVHAIDCAAFPAHVDRLSLFLVVLGVRRAARIDCRLEPLDQDGHTDSVARATIDVSAATPLDLIAVAIELNDLKLEGQGLYRMYARPEGEDLATWTIRIRRANSPP